MENVTAPQPHNPKTSETDATLPSQKQQLEDPLDYVTQNILIGLIKKYAGQLPIGSVYINTTDGTDPSTLLGYGTWDPIEGEVIAGYKASDPDFGTIGASIGEAKHILTDGEMPAHIFNVFGSASGAWGVTAGNTYGTATGLGQGHNNIQPTRVAYVWERTG